MTRNGQFDKRIAAAVTVIYLGGQLLAPSSDLPESGNDPSRFAAGHRSGSASSLFDLASGGVYQASRVAAAAGELLPHRFTLTTHQRRALAVRRYAFCGTFPNLAIGRRYRPPCSTKPGLSSPQLLSD